MVAEPSAREPPQRSGDVAADEDGELVDLLAKSFALVVLHQRDTKRQGGPSLTKGGKDYESMAKAFGRGIMASRRTLDEGRFILTVPAGVLLALLG